MRRAALTLLNLTIEIDSDLGVYSADFDRAQVFKIEILGYIQARLGLCIPKKPFTTTNPIIKSFDVIGDAMRKICTLGKTVILRPFEAVQHPSQSREYSS